MAHGLAGLSDLSVPMVVQSMRANDAQAGEKGMAVDNVPEHGLTIPFSIAVFCVASFRAFL
jgi:hypothetical protein